MTTSPCSSRPARPALCGLSFLSLLFCFGGCTDPGKPEPCTNDDQPPIQEPPDTTALLAKVTLEASASFDQAGAITESNDLLASLVDLKSVETYSRAPTLVGSPACYGLTGSLTRICKPPATDPCNPEPIDADKVTVEGLAGGTRDLARSSKGVFSTEGLTAPLFGTGEATVKVTGRPDAGFFPSMEVSVSPPDPLQVTAPAAGGTPLGAGDLRVKWAKGNGDYVVINVSDPTGKTKDKIQCVVLDDGCHTIQAGDLEQYGLVVGSKVKLSLIRERVRIKVSGTASLEVKAVSHVDLVVVR